MFTLMIKNENISTEIQYGILSHNQEKKDDHRVITAFQTKISVQDNEPEDNLPDILNCITAFTRDLHDYFSQPN